jgi:hypothetical protein
VGSEVVTSEVLEVDDGVEVVLEVVLDDELLELDDDEDEDEDEDELLDDDELLELLLDEDELDDEDDEDELLDEDELEELLELDDELELLDDELLELDDELEEELDELLELEDDELEEDELDDEELELGSGSVVELVGLGSMTSIATVALPCSAGGGVLPPSSTTTVTDPPPAVSPVAVSAPSCEFSEARSPDRFEAEGVTPTPVIVAVSVPSLASGSVTENGMATDDPMSTDVAPGAVTTGGSLVSSRTVMSNESTSNPRGSGMATPSTRFGVSGRPLLPRSCTTTLTVSSASVEGTS